MRFSPWKARLVGLAVLLAVGVSSPATAQTPTIPPQQAFGPLFSAVEMARVYPDSKTFADATPRFEAAEILRRYHAAQPTSPEALRRFVEANFVIAAPATAPPARSAQPAPLLDHIDGLWPVLTRDTPKAATGSSAIPLPAPYVVPGGRFGEVYYWDSYFTMLGLERAGRADLVQDMLRDFASLIDRYGYIPNGARTYYLGRSQPPFFFEMTALLDPKDPAAGYAAYLPQLKVEYAFWMKGQAGLAPGQARGHVVRLADGAVLNRYWGEPGTPRDESYREDVELAHQSGRDPAALYHDIRGAAESGWDFSSRWLRDGHTLASIDTGDIIPIDLNSLLFGLENAIRQGCARTGDAACARDFERQATARRAAIDRYLWNAKAGYYVDYDWSRGAAGQALTAAALYPLFVGLADQAQATSTVQAVASGLLRPGGLATTTVVTGQQWDEPNGWAPLQWIAVAGLEAYGQTGLAQTIACRWVVNVDRVYRQTGKLVEKYDVDDLARAGGGGEYPTQDGFGWTNGVTRALVGRYGAAGRGWLEGRGEAGCRAGH